MLKCVMVVFECDSHTSAKTVMTSNKCAMQCTCDTGYIHVRDSLYVVTCHVQLS